MQDEVSDNCFCKRKVVIRYVLGSPFLHTETRRTISNASYHLWGYMTTRTAMQDEVSDN